MPRPNPPKPTLATSFRQRDHLTFLALLYICFAYWLGIIQDFYYGVTYLLDVASSGESSGSFPFMFGWTALMLWGVLKPIERRIVLILTALLVACMFVDNMLRVSASNFEGNPYVQLVGTLLWSSAYLMAHVLAKPGKTSRVGPDVRDVRGGAG